MDVSSASADIDVDLYIDKPKGLKLNGTKFIN